MNLRLERSDDLISLLPALTRGGEGSIHPVLGEPGIVAKVFAHPSMERADKLRAMIDYPPVVAGNAPVVLAWPSDRLLNVNGECVGYVMPYVKDKEPLFTMSHPGTRPRWADYPFLLRTAKNIAVAVSAFHRHGYVVGDINEFNILVGPDASVAVVDTDSIQVRTKRKLFRCQVGKPEFTPPELLRAGTSFDQVDRYPHHDSFGLAVLIFLLLMDGNHPFAARYMGTAGRQTQTQRIAQGQWPYSAGQKGAYRPRRQAPPLESLSPQLQGLMRDCFETGHKNPKRRPTADDWHRALAQAESEWKEIRPRLRHFYHRLLKPQAWRQSFLDARDRLQSAVAHWKVIRRVQACRQSVLDAQGRLRSAVARLPRKVWIAASCVVVIALLIVAFLLGRKSAEPQPPVHTSEQTIQRSEPEAEGDRRNPVHVHS
jgi:DNA-binding helix-hairpin-helix protein with protein kinase domain